MDILRLSLKVLFQSRHLNLQQLQREFPSKLIYRNVDSDEMIHEMRELDTAYTLDELKSVFGLMSDEWMQKGSDINLQYTLDASVFNVLLHFTSKTLVLRNDEPCCRYKNLFRWHDLTQFIGEDLPVLSYLASHDVKCARRRNSFLWDEYIPHDNDTLNSVLKKDIAELHAHLGGSSYAFSLNWMSLMNDLRECFNTLRTELKLRLTSNKNVYEEKTSLPLLVAKASVIRFYLVALITDQTIAGKTKLYVDNLLSDILMCDDELMAIRLLTKLQDRIIAYNKLHGFCYELWDEQVYVDYAIQANTSFTCTPQDDIFYMSLLSGERHFMYRILCVIYSGTENFELETQLFYVYLLIKAKFRQEFIQLNSYRGFENFKEYQDRKDLFLRKPIYKKLNTLLAVQSYFVQDNVNRHLELRVTPKGSLAGMKSLINGLEKYRRMSSPLITYANNGRECNYIFHFIKSEDKNTSDRNCRNFKVRETVREQAIAIVKTQIERKKTYKKLYPVVGVDAASSEFHCRPEVFAQAFRYIRGETAYYSKDVTLGLTYHVGEDFYDIVDGLRAVDEVLQFMNFGNGDRIGHGLALGTDVHRYYQNRNNTAVMPLQTLLDNIAWLYVQSTAIANEFQSEREWLNYEFERFFHLIFADWNKVSIKDYYDSWLLRSDDPQMYKGAEKNYLFASRIFGWNKYAMSDKPDVDLIRKNNEDSVKLYRAYHFMPKIKERGAKKTQWKITNPRIYDLIDNIREKLLCEVEERHIHIECNPTSNIKIGSFCRYDDHPIFRYFNYHLNTRNLPKHGISVSINTDDKGVFATSLEREYSLIALAIEKLLADDGVSKLNQPLQVYEWIDKVRKMSIEAKFG